MLYYYGYRFYAPNLQRWVNRDVIQEYGGFNLFAFVNNNPVCQIDLLGLAFFPPEFIGPLQPADQILPHLQPIREDTRDALQKFFSDKDPSHLDKCDRTQLEKARDNALRAVKRYEGQNRADRFPKMQEDRARALDDYLNPKDPDLPWWKTLFEFVPDQFPFPPVFILPGQFPQPSMPEPRYS